MASNIFGPTEEPQNIPKGTKPREGKGSGIFDESTPVQTRQRLNPAGGKTSDIFGSPVAAASPMAHPTNPRTTCSCVRERTHRTSEPRPAPPPDKSRARHVAREEQPAPSSRRPPSAAVSPGCARGLAPTTKS
ncbi:hypothetical protein J1605_019312 [Eschrichtius robustus]|uniref:Hematological and neurological expressed 1-like protein n=1 Tax=Eschrichtius robustus TaxID=9764 RepID=A0AB34HMP5_ESCRO|nr:hypothetical protein J1605_019312 [Eschrichtius robustus]